RNLVVAPPDGRELGREPQIVDLPQHNAVGLRFRRRGDGERDPDPSRNRAQNRRGVIHFLHDVQREASRISKGNRLRVPDGATTADALRDWDSPVGLAGYFLDHDARSYELITRVFEGKSEGLTRDDILDNITITWLTNTALSGARLYWEYWGKGYFN